MFIIKKKKKKIMVNHGEFNIIYMNELNFEFVSSYF